MAAKGSIDPLAVVRARSLKRSFRDQMPKQPAGSPCHPPPLQHMGADHRCRHVGRHQKLSHGLDLGTHLPDAEAILHIPNALAQLVQNPDGLQRRDAGFNRISITGHTYSMLSDKPGC